MKITRENLSGSRTFVSNTVARAVVDAAIPSCSDDDRDRMNSTIKNTYAMLATLSNILHDKEFLDNEEVIEILNSGSNDDYRIED